MAILHTLSLSLFSLIFLSSFPSSFQSGLVKNVSELCIQDTSLGSPNLNAIDDRTAKLVDRVQNGSLFTVGSGDDRIWLIHLWGTTGYDYGFAYGSLLKEQVQQFLPRAWNYFQTEIIRQLKDLKLPKWYERLISDKGLGYALDSQNNFASNYIDNEIYQEMRGIADAAKVDFTTLRRLHMIGEITRGSYFDI